jgi:serine protease Do
VVGEDVIAIGNPLGSLGGTVTEGMISATAREIVVGGTSMTLLQTSAPVNEGNSGGGLFNMAGELMGLVNVKIASNNAEGLGFAIPVDTLYDVVLELIHYGYVRGRPALDFEVVDITSYQAAYFYFKSASIGVFVYDQDHDTLRYGDRIIYADGITVTRSEQLDELVRGKKIGDTLSMTVKRGRDEITVTVTVVEYRPSSARTEE